MYNYVRPANPKSRGRITDGTVRKRKRLPQKKKKGKESVNGMIYTGSRIKKIV
jgi:hypothetical protein